MFNIWESTFSERCQFRVQMLSEQISKRLLKTNCALSRVVKVYLCFTRFFFRLKRHYLFFFVERFFRRVVLHSEIVERLFNCAKLYDQSKHVFLLSKKNFHGNRKMLKTLLLKMDKYIFFVQLKHLFLEKLYPKTYHSNEDNFFTRKFFKKIFETLAIRDIRLFRIFSVLLN